MIFFRPRQKHNSIIQRRFAAQHLNLVFFLYTIWALACLDSECVRSQRLSCLNLPQDYNVLYGDIKMEMLPKFQFLRLHHFTRDELHYACVGSRRLSSRGRAGVGTGHSGRLTTSTKISPSWVQAKSREDPEIDMATGCGKTAWFFLRCAWKLREFLRCTF